MANIKDKSKTIFFFQESFFSGENCIWSLWLLNLNYFITESFRLVTFGKTLVQQLQFVEQFENRLMVLQCLIIDNNTRMSIF